MPKIKNNIFKKEINEKVKITFTTNNENDTLINNIVKKMAEENPDLTITKDDALEVIFKVAKTHFKKLV